MPRRLTVPLEEDDNEALTRLAAAADTGAAAWVRGAIRTAAADERIARKIAENSDQAGWGGWRPGAGRPKRAMTEDET